MGDYTTTKLNPDTHLILDQPLIRLPYELLRKNFKGAQRVVEQNGTSVTKTLRDTANASLSNSSSPDDVLKNLDAMITRMRGLKRKLTSYADEEKKLHEHSQARIKHLGELYTMQSLEDVKYEAWSRTRLDRLLVDYLLRHGYKDSATALANEKGINNLVDVDAFVNMNRIRESLRNGEVKEALAWCQENKKELRKLDSNLEFMLRYQQFIELVRTQDPAKLKEAIQHAKKFLYPSRAAYPKEVQQAAGLLVFRPGSRLTKEYEEIYSQSRWTNLANTFLQSHNQLLSLSPVPVLHTALSAGLSALKTPSCHSSNTTTSPSHSSAIGSSVCPICSIELNDLARNVPYAHHTSSHTAPDCVVLPNMRVYSRSKLEEYSRKGGLSDDYVKDLRTGDVFEADKIKKVYIS